jgi:hypothetical protein
VAVAADFPRRDSWKVRHETDALLVLENIENIENIAGVR